MTRRRSMERQATRPRVYNALHPDRLTTAYKTIQRHQIRYPALAALQPGDLTLEGMVVGVSLFRRSYTTAAGEFTVDAEDQGIPVFGHVPYEMVRETIEALETRAR